MTANRCVSRERETVRQIEIMNKSKHIIKIKTHRF